MKSTLPDRSLLSPIDKTLQKLLIVGVIFVMATYALRAMANLPLELPDGYSLERDFLLS
jgi:hypothetical protein